MRPGGTRSCTTSGSIPSASCVSPTRRLRSRAPPVSASPCRVRGSTRSVSVVAISSIRRSSGPTEPRDALRERREARPRRPRPVRVRARRVRQRRPARARARPEPANTGIAELVHFLGFVETDDLVALYQHAHALTYLSFFSPENLPPLEAFALGCPVVAADVPGAREQLGEAAVFVPPTDPVLVQEAVRRLEEPAFRAELVELGRQRAALRTPEAYVRGVVSFLDEFEPTRRSWA